MASTSAEPAELAQPDKENAPVPKKRPRKSVGGHNKRVSFGSTLIHHFEKDQPDGDGTPSRNTRARRRESTCGTVPEDAAGEMPGASGAGSNRADAENVPPPPPPPPPAGADPVSPAPSEEDVVVLKPPRLSALVREDEHAETAPPRLSDLLDGDAADADADHDEVTMDMTIGVGGIVGGTQAAAEPEADDSIMDMTSAYGGITAVTPGPPEPHAAARDAGAAGAPAAPPPPAADGAARGRRRYSISDKLAAVSNWAYNKAAGAADDEADGAPGSAARSVASAADDEPSMAFDEYLAAAGVHFLESADGNRRRHTIALGSAKALAGLLGPPGDEESHADALIGACVVQPELEQLVRSPPPMPSEHTMLARGLAACTRAPQVWASGELSKAVGVLEEGRMKMEEYVATHAPGFFSAPETTCAPATHSVHAMIPWQPYVSHRVVVSLTGTRRRSSRRSRGAAGRRRAPSGMSGARCSSRTSARSSAARPSASTPTSARSRRTAPGSRSSARRRGASARLRPDAHTRSPRSLRRSPPLRRRRSTPPSSSG